MAIIKCKMCGGELNITEGISVATCEYCGTTQTLPKLDDERRANLYDRASHFRRNNDFDKAAGLYNQILNEDPTDAEAYWSLVLCKYGIEYVEDPTTRKRIPTVNRAQFTSVVADEDYKKAVEHADALSRSLYEQEAHAIDEIQKGILAISSQEEPFDVFICYKETDRNGRRTPDSVLANDLYHQLTQEGFKVFFARITLEDKLGSAYEPYIFAALNSAKVMVALGTKPEYFNAVWVKNEWSRYLSLIRGGAKKVLIPAYRDMDPYDLPEEFSHLQAQDMSKLGFMQDLIRGIKKIAGTNEQPKTIVKETVTVAAGADTAPLLRRVALFLEDGNWTEADTYCERVLDMDPENAQAYLGKLMAELRVRQQENLANCEKPFDDRNNYKKALRFADDKLAAELKGYITHINQRNEEARLNGIYTDACRMMANASTEEAFLKAAARFEEIPSYKDSAEKAAECLENAEIQRKDDIYNSACRYMEYDTVEELENAIRRFKEIPNWKDANEKIEQCQQRIHELEEAKKLGYYQEACGLMEVGGIDNLRTARDYFKYRLQGWRDSADKLEECLRLIKEREDAKKKQEDAKKDEIYNAACEFKDKNSLAEVQNAYDMFDKLIGWRDAWEKREECKQKIHELKRIEDEKAEAARLAAEQEAETARLAAKKKKKRNTILVLTALVLIAAAALAYVFVLQPMMQYKAAEELLAAGDFDGAIAVFDKLGDYKDSADRVLEVRYLEAEAYFIAGDYEDARAAFKILGNYKDSEQRLQLVKEAAIEKESADSYDRAMELLKSGKNEDLISAYFTLSNLGDYKDATSLLSQFVFSHRLVEDKWLYEGKPIAEDQYIYNADGTLRKQVSTMSAWIATEYFYNEAGNLIQTKKAESRTSSGHVNYQLTSYDENGNPVKIISEDRGLTLNFVYDYAEDGTPVEVTYECVPDSTFFKPRSGTIHLIVDGKQLMLSHEPGDISLYFKYITNDRRFMQEYALLGGTASEFDLYKTDSGEIDGHGNYLTCDRASGVLNPAGLSYSHAEYINSYDDFGNLIYSKETYDSGYEYEYSYTYETFVIEAPAAP